MTIGTTTGNAQIAINGQSNCSFDGSTTAGDELGQFGNNSDQFRGLVETGILF